jgi:hypothetical protein
VYSKSAVHKKRGMSVKRCYDEQGNFLVRPYSLKELAAVYGVHYKRLRAWIDEMAAEHGEKKGKYFSIAQVRGIVTAIGFPAKISPTMTMA